MRWNRLVLGLAPIGQNRDDEEQGEISTKAGFYWPGQGREGTRWYSGWLLLVRTGTRRSRWYSGRLRLVRTGMRRNKLVLRLVPVNHGRDDKKQVGTQAAAYGRVRSGTRGTGGWYSG
jgi:hypothetical protein